MTNSHHHQAVKQLASGLTATAWAQDGVIEGAEKIDEPFCVAVQWHPERLWNQPDGLPHRALFAALWMRRNQLQSDRQSVPFVV